MEAIIWDCGNSQTKPQDWKMLVRLSTTIIPLYQCDRQIVGFVYKSLVRFWDNKILKEMDHDYREQEEIDEAICSEEDSDPTFEVQGTLSLLFPKILDHYESQLGDDKIEYVKPLKCYSLKPFKLNMLHYFAIKNNDRCVTRALETDYNYESDTFGNAPLRYALDNNCYQTSDALLIKADSVKKFYGEMEHSDLIELIELDSERLEQFFTEADELI